MIHIYCDQYVAPLRSVDIVDFIFCLLLLALQHWNFAISEDHAAFLPFDRVQGADDDIGANAILYYHIIDGGRLFAPDHRISSYTDI